MSPISTDLADSNQYQNIFHWAETQKDGAIPSFRTRHNDPYKVSKELIQPQHDQDTKGLFSIKPGSATRMFSYQDLAIQLADLAII